MRLVVLAVAGLALFAAMPAVEAGNECQTNTASGRVCQTLTVPSPDPRVPPGVAGTYYVYTAPTACLNPLASDCRGTPAGPGSTLGVFGMVYRESNALPGLQRSSITVDGRIFPADSMVVL